MPKTVEIERSTIISAPIAEVWKITATEFEHIDRWDGNVKASRRQGSTTTGAPIGGRVCDLYSGGETVEKFVEFDEANFTFAYEITKGLPGFVVSARNTWLHEAVSTDKTRLTMRVTMIVKGILGTIMQGPMKSQMGKVLGNAQEELKHYIETGKAHPRKQKKMRRTLTETAKQF